MSDAARAFEIKLEIAAMIGRYVKAGAGDDALVAEAIFQNFVLPYTAAQTAALRSALEASTGELDYWLKTYRSHSGFMNATHLMEQEALFKRVTANRALLAAPERSRHA